MRRLPLPISALLLLLPPALTAAGDLKLTFPLERAAYQTNERIDLTVAPPAGGAFAAEGVRLSLRGEDGTEMSFLFPLSKGEGGAARAVEHLHVNGWLLRPGKYTAKVENGGNSASGPIELFSHVRRSSFRLVNWGRAKDDDILAEGEKNLGYNLFYGNPGAAMDERFIKAGVDFMSNCTMSGAHQMDIRMECDWSDPYVVRGGTRRVVRRALMDRTKPNVPGVHFYDEPGLTWAKDPQTGELTPHAIPSQWAAYEAAFGEPKLDAKALNPRDPAAVARWAQWARWKLGFMDAAWQDAQFGVSTARPGYLSVTQSQYGWGAFTDGYYFNVVRSLPVISGHGGYHDYGPGFFNPSYTLEMARARDFARPDWYLPSWYGNTPPDLFRLEQYLAFQTNIQGMLSPPDLEPGGGKSAALQGIVESNQLMGRLGTVFDTMPVTAPPVAVLYSLSQMIHAQTEDRTKNYSHEILHGHNLPFTYVAAKMIQQPTMAVVEEDILDGTLAARHKAVILTSIDYLDPAVIARLEAYAARGGAVLMTGDSTVKIAGAVNLGATPRFPQEEKIKELMAAKQNQEAGKLMTLREMQTGAKPLAEALRRELERAKIRPALGCDQPGISASRQAAGEVEYLFAVNATLDPAGDAMVGVGATTANVALPADGRPVYDAVRGGTAADFGAPTEGELRGKIRFGAGEMRVWARTARPIAKVSVAAPLLRTDLTKAEAPLALEVSAAVLDAQGGVISGSVPMRARVTDPAGGVRYDLYRATEEGVLRLALPMAMNDPEGEWRVEVSELLGGNAGSAKFHVAALPEWQAIAGASWRAVYFPEEREHVFAFFRTHQKVTLVKGTAPFEKAAAERLAKSLEPWGVKCTIMEAAEAAHPRILTDKELPTWVGLGFGRADAQKPDASVNGFAVEGPVILLGTPEDNPLSKFLSEQHFLPYKPGKGVFPGPGRGYIAWQRDGIGPGQESITLMADDEAGMGEAVGSLYELAAGLEPLTRERLPEPEKSAAAKAAAPAPGLTVEWSRTLPDRIEGIDYKDGKLIVRSHDGSERTLTAAGEASGEHAVEGAPAGNASADPARIAALQKKNGPGRLVKLVATEGEKTAVAYWGGGLEIQDASGGIKAAEQFDQDLSALAWAGGKLAAGDANGRVMLLKTGP